MYNHGREISPDDNEEEPVPGCSHYVNEVRESISSNEGSSPNLTMGYHRSSSSSTASSGKQLVKSQQLPSHSRTHNDSFYDRFERGYGSREGRYIHHHHHHHRRGDGLSSSSPSPSPEVPKKKPPMFFLGPPSTPGSTRSFHSPLRESPSSSPSPEMPSTPTNERVKSPHLLHPNYGLDLHPSHLLTPPDKDGKISSIYDSYWHIPRASLWCKHNNCEDPDQTCTQCQKMKDEISSTCSSISPPPTFTAMDNYHPIRKRPKKCVCGAISIATLILSTIILVFIAAFILYFEIVLKNNQYVPSSM